MVCEELDLRYTHAELQQLFSYLDADGGGSIGYLEFTKLTDEKRMGLDPFANQTAHVKRKYDIKDLENSRP